MKPSLAILVFLALLASSGCARRNASDPGPATSTGLPYFPPGGVRPVDVSPDYPIYPTAPPRVR